MNMTLVNSTMSGHISYTVIIDWPGSHTDLHNDPLDGGQLVGSHSKFKINQTKIYSMYVPVLKGIERQVSILIIYF